jgi:hypothetical protein
MILTLEHGWSIAGSIGSSLKGTIMQIRKEARTRHGARILVAALCGVPPDGWTLRSMGVA